MPDRGAWLKALARVADGHDEAGGGPCPACGRDGLRARYIVDAGSRIGYALLWCDACLHGIGVSRVRAPEGVRMWPIGDPASVAGVPDFTHDG
ncbi:hypothetical protein ACKI1I_00175 [Streptomyces turgidiscabies]|uniref:Uncharacterized protein n=1 Tax=Streptomyces turgidiscabies (strain Car8) TaxID=698760 RepID=L7FC81_STRT8|nr:MULTISPECIES: hypothetical protein [Streptomyces]ELP68265.1 hypothetical protein STRTUCAR8_04952 [Streptomyces turgidiscabies Car8]MDX3492703.1 hypothetical protein [Streptomyces turgidiscabies]GAQ75678.1 hypothetical protein T45_07466 [Streptomyces turgidiscabies]